MLSRIWTELLNIRTTLPVKSSTMKLFSSLQRIFELLAQEIDVLFTYRCILDLLNGVSEVMTIKFYAGFFIPDPDRFIYPTFYIFYEYIFVGLYLFLFENFIKVQSVSLMLFFSFTNYYRKLKYFFIIIT